MLIRSGIIKNLMKGKYYKKIGLEYWEKGCRPEAHVALLTAYRFRPWDREIRSLLTRSFGLLQMTWFP